MEKHTQTLIQIINHILVQHPEIIRPVRDIAQQQLTSLEMQNLSAKEVFTKIYTEGLWGKNGRPEQPFFSGSGSHTNDITSTYVQSVSNFIKSLNIKPNALDLGCGDFNVGSQIREYCGIYIACDIVNALIEFNKHKFSKMDVDFRVLDLIEDELPKADVVFIRQVLQHLSNAQIQKLLPKLNKGFTWLILTEHLPSNGNFPHNLDQNNSHNIRLGRNSGVVLSSPPFNLSALEERVLCEVREGSGTIKTIAYRFQ